MRRVGIWVALAFLWGCSGEGDGRAVEAQVPRPFPGLPDGPLVPMPRPQEPELPGEPAVEAPFEVRITMEPEDLEELYARDLYADDRLPARVLLPGMDEPVETEGIEFRGSNSRTYPKKGFDLRLSEPHPLVFGGDGRPGSTRMNLNAMWTDPTGMRERLAFQLYEEAGVPAPGTYYADVYLNDVFEGLYVGLERVDEDLLERRGLSTGNFTLVRDEMKDYLELPDRRSAFSTPVGELGATDEERIATLQEVFNTRGEDENQDWAAVLDLVRFVNETEAGPAFAEGFRARFDEERVLDFLAIHALTQDSDSLDIDYWLYRDNEGGEWIAIPWDKNLTLGKSYFEGVGGANDYLAYDLGIFSTQGNDLFQKVLQTGELRAALDERIRVQMERFTAAWFREEGDAIQEAIRPSLEREPGPDAYEIHPQQHFGELGRSEENAEALYSFVERRYQYLDRLLDPPAEGEELAAEVELQDAAAGERIFLVDAAGWVIGDLVLAEAVGSSRLAVEVAERPSEGGVDRVWNFVVDGEPVAGELSLYYRNLPAPFENWAPEMEPIGSQGELVMARLGEDGSTEQLASEANPYADRVRADVELAGTQRFVLEPGR